MTYLTTVLIHISGSKTGRKDRNAKRGGIMVFYRSDIPVRRMNSLNAKKVRISF